MDIIAILKNKFVLSLILSIILLLCYYQFDKIKSKTDEENETEERNMIFYCKYLVLFYIISFVLVLAVSKGYEYYNKNNIEVFNSLVNKSKENQQIEDNSQKLKLLEERKQKLLELKKQEHSKKQEQSKKLEQAKKQEQEKRQAKSKKQTGGEEKSYTIETIDETVKTPEKKSEQDFNMGNPSF